MKRNVDLTENLVFNSEFFRPDRPKAVLTKFGDREIVQISPDSDVIKEVMDFVEGKSLMATGDAVLRRWKIEHKQRRELGVCEECERIIRAPWVLHSRGLCKKCVEEYEKYDRLRLIQSNSYISRRIPWKNKTYSWFPRRIPWQT